MALRVLVTNIVSAQPNVVFWGRGLGAPTELAAHIDQRHGRHRLARRVVVLLGKSNAQPRQHLGRERVQQGGNTQGTAAIGYYGAIDGERRGMISGFVA